MPNLIINQNQFCPNDQFLDLVVDILCNPKGIFDVLAKNPIKDIYDDMRQKINCNQYCIYPLPGSSVQNGINNSLLISNGRYYAGHDLPVWLNNPSIAKHKILVLSQDPRRNDKEMTGKEIGISTPFGLHSMKWRSNRSKGLVHYLFDKLQNKYGDEVCVYYTDIYKFRKTEPAQLDIKNLGRYQSVLCLEIESFKPTIMLLMGNEAQKAFDHISCDVLKTSHPQIIKTPHPNARVIDNKWGRFEMEKFDVESKIDKIYTEIDEIINS